MHTDLIIAVLELAERQGVVEVLGVCGVDGECKGVAEILAAFQVVGSDLVGDLVGGVLHLLGETVRKAELGKYRVHLGLIVAGHSEDIHDVALRAHVITLPAVHDGCGLHTGLAAHGEGLLLVHFDVVGHGLALHEHPGLGSHEMEDADVRTVRTLYDLDHLAFATLHTNLLLGQGDADGIAVQGVLGLGGLDEDIVLLALHHYEDESLAAHLNLADELGIILERLGAAAPAAPRAGRRPGLADGAAAPAAGTFPAVSFTRHISAVGSF